MADIFYIRTVLRAPHFVPLLSVAQIVIDFVVLFPVYYKHDPDGNWGWACSRANVFGAKASLFDVFDAFASSSSLAVIKLFGWGAGGVYMKTIGITNTLIC